MSTTEAQALFERLMNSPHYSLNFLILIGDLQDFLETSEMTVKELHRAALAKIKADFSEPLDENDYSEYRHELETAEFRFEQALPTRIRYSVVSGLVTALEYTAMELKRWAKKPRIKGEDVAVFEALLERLGEPATNEMTELIRNLILARNAIAHGAGTRLRQRSGGKDIDAVVAGIPGFRMDRYLLIGPAIFIEDGALPPILKQVENFIHDLHKRCNERRLMK